MPITSFGAPCERLSAHQRIHPISERIQVRNLHHLRLGALGVLLASIGLAGNQAHALGFSEALDLAEQHSPRITAQRLQIDAASSSQKSAGTLPDPKLSVGIENFPVSGMDRFSLTRESMTMQRLALMQEVPNHVVNFALSMLPAMLLGFSAEAILAYLAVSQPVLMLQHANLDLRSGWANYVFSTNELHRWHHSTESAEADANFESAFILWDQVFGTFRYQPGQNDPAQVGLFSSTKDYPAHAGYWIQLKSMFTPDCCRA